MLFALHAPDTKFCEDGLMMVNWPKHVVKIKIIGNVLFCLTDTKNCFVVS